MSITVLREGDVFGLVSATESIVEGQSLVLVASPARSESGYSALEAAQLKSVFNEDDEDWGESLVPFRQPRLRVNANEPEDKVNPGDLFEVCWPRGDQSAAKCRVAVALSSTDSHGDLELLVLTTQSHHQDAVCLDVGDFAASPLPKKCFVRIGRPLKLRMDNLTPLGLRLTAECMSRLCKALILCDTRSFSRLAHSLQRPGMDPLRGPFVAGQSTVPYAGRVFDEDEVEAAVSSALDFWLTLGPEGDRFEEELAKFLGVKKTILVNSGSSANLLAISALTSTKLGERQLKRGDEVITVAAGFPTTVAPIVQNGLIPVFIDNDPVTLNARVEQLEDAYVQGKTKAVMMAHTLGNPFDLGAVMEFCKRHQLWLIEDNCDALGGRYDGKLTGSFGDLSSQSFYPPHHLTTGEGGAVNVTREMRLKVLVESFRDWGRDCWCASGKDNTCNKRFGWQLGELPEGYDHKYIYSHLGYNLKPLDLQAAIGRQQLRKLPDFIQARVNNWHTLRRELADLEAHFDFQLPTHASGWTEDGFTWDRSGHKAEPSWFGFTLRIRPKAPFKRRDLALALDAAKIGSRMLFGGNLTRQPAFVSLKQQQASAFRIVGDLGGANRILEEVLFIGIYPGLTPDMLGYMVETIRGFVKKAVK